MAIKWGFKKEDKQATSEPEPISITERRRVVIVGDGFPAALWAERLTANQIDYLETKSISAEDIAKTEFEVIIETEGLAQVLTPYEDDGPTQAPALVEGGIILVPCYAASPTSMASTLGDLAPHATGYTLFYPPTADPNVQPVIETARPMQASDQAWNSATAFLEEAGFHIEFAGDSPGLVFARTLACLINEAAFALSENIASAGDIDAAMQLGVNYPKGLFAWADELGLELIVDILEGLAAHYEEDRYRPAPLLKHLAVAGKKFLG